MFSDIVCAITEGVQKPQSDKTNTMEPKCRSPVPYLALSEVVIFLGFISNSKIVEKWKHLLFPFIQCNSFVAVSLLLGKQLKV